MRLCTNPGSHLPQSALARYDVMLSRQQIVVDGVSHDTRRDIPLSVVDGRIARSKQFPRVVGSSAQDLLPLFLEALGKDRELLVLTTSRRLIQTYDSAVAAASSARARASQRDASITVLDTQATDLGAGLCCIAAGEAIRAGVPLDKLTATVESMGERMQMCMYVRELDNLHKSGRASFLRAWMASVLQVRPLIGFSGGDLRVIGRAKLRDDKATVVADELAARLPTGARLWIGIAHGNDREAAERCLDIVRQRHEVVFSVVRPASSSIYTYSGPGALAAFAVPIDELPWVPTTPQPPLAEV